MYSMMTDETDGAPADVIAAAERVSATAARWEPIANGVFGIVLFLVVGDAILEPLVSSLSSNGWYPMATALRHIRDNVVSIAPVYALIWILWESRVYLARLRRGEIWLSSTQQTLYRIGLGLIVAAALGLAARPLMLAINGNAVEFDLSPSWLSLGGVGWLVFMIARVTSAVTDAALALKKDNEEII